MESMISSPYVVFRADNSMALSDTARELSLYAENIEAYTGPVIRSLSKHYKRGNYSFDLAIKSIERYCLQPAAKQYHVEYGSTNSKWSDMFPKCVRFEAAKDIASRWTAEFKLGNFWED